MILFTVATLRELRKRMPSPARRSAVVLALFCAGVVLILAAEDRPVALPPFIVEEATKGPPWRYAESSGYEVLSRCSDPMTRRVFEAHQRLHQLLAEMLPPQFRVAMSVPRSLILYDEELQPAASQEVIARLLRRPVESTWDEPPSFAGRGGLRAPASAPRYSFLPNLRLWDRDGMAVFMIVRRDDFAADRLALTHDYVSFLVKSRLPALPPWFVHGFLKLFQQVSFGGDRLTLEPMTWISERHTDAVKREPTTAPPLLPLADLLSHTLGVRPPEADYEPVQRWYAMAVLFVRWGLDPSGGNRRQAFWRFAERVAIEGASEPLFADCFGFEFAVAQTQLAAYLPVAVRRSLQFRPTKWEKPAPLVLRDASDGQIARLKGDWERLEIPYVKAISAELAPKYLEQARRTLRRAYDRGERDPRLLAVMGLCEVDAGNDADAREYLEAAVRIGSVRPRAQYELARLRFAEARERPAGVAGSLNTAQTAAVLRPLFDARAEQPPLPEVYELIAEVWANSEATPTRGHLAVLEEGVRFFPRRTSLVVRAAEVNLQRGFREPAATFLEIATRLAEDEETRARVAALQAQLAQR